MAWSQLDPSERYLVEVPTTSFCAIYTNNTEEEVTISSVALVVGTLHGTVGDTSQPDTLVTGDGSPITMNVGGISQQVTNKVSVIPSTSISTETIPDLSQTAEYQFNLTSPITLGPGESTGNAISISLTSTSTSSYLVVKEITGDGNSSVELVNITYHANGGVFASGEDEYISPWCEAGSTIEVMADVHLLPVGKEYVVVFNNNLRDDDSLEHVESICQTLSEWNTSADGSGVAYTLDAEIEMNDNVDLYAIWNNPQLTQDMFPAFSREGYVLEEWNTSRDGSERVVRADEVVSENLELFSIWIGCPIWIYTEDGWKLISSQKVPEDLTNINNVSSASSLNFWKVAWNQDKPIYQWNGESWEVIHKGSRYGD